MWFSIVLIGIQATVKRQSNAHNDNLMVLICWRLIRCTKLHTKLQFHALSLSVHCVHSFDRREISFLSFFKLCTPSCWWLRGPTELELAFFFCCATVYTFSALYTVIRAQFYCNRLIFYCQYGHLTLFRYDLIKLNLFYSEYLEKNVKHSWIAWMPNLHYLCSDIRCYCCCCCI